MSRPRLSEAKYHEEAQRRDLEFVSAAVPPTVNHLADWRCQQCGRIIRRTLTVMRAVPYPCICRSGATLQREDYQRLEQKFAITLLSRTLPHNNKHKVWWQTQAGIMFEASYADITHRPTHKIRELLGIEV